MKKPKGGLVRTNITREADAYLEKLSKRANTDFEAGRVNKSSLASWIVMWFEAQEKDKHISMIQKAHFDPLKHLENLVKKMKSSGAESMSAEDMALALAPMAQKSRSNPLKIKKSE